MKNNEVQIMRVRSRKVRPMKRLAVLAGVLSLSVMLMAGCGGKDEDKAAGESKGNEDAEQQVGLAFPYEVDGGNILVNSVFSSDIMNPDCNDEYGDGIISVELTNQSDKTLKTVDIEVTLENGTLVPVHAEYVPSGATIWAFASDNASADPVICTEVRADAEHAAGTLVDEDSFEIAVEDTQISITNISSEDKSGLTVYCHCDMGDALFGGKAYAYPLEYISAGETVVIEAEECYLGTAQVVCIE